MTRQRLRVAHDEQRLREIYATPHDHRHWDDHVLRVDATIALAKWMAGDGVRSAADLSCGNGAILRAVPAEVRHFGDFAPGHGITGPIEKTLFDLPPVDMFVCAETLEHLDDPDAVLHAIRQKARLLVLSTPVDAWDDANPEHYWAWGRRDVEEMLEAAGWRPGPFMPVDFRPLALPYAFGIWGAR